MAKAKQKKQKLSVTPNPSSPVPVKKLKKSKQINPSRKCESKPKDKQKQLESYSKEQLIDIVIDSALLNPTVISKIQAFDSDISRRKIFVHGLRRSTTNKNVIAEFSQFGEIENCNLVMDRATGKAKGYAFITFKSSKSALKALKQPKKLVKNRVVGCKFATRGNVSASVSGRKIFVYNVTSDVNPDRLRSFFASFGEIESGPTGLDPDTRKFKGYALFVYKTLEGAKKVLEEPRKVFEGRQLHCQKGDMIAGGAAGITTSVQAVPPVYAALASGQNMGLKTHNPPNASVIGALLAQNPNAVPPVYAPLASGQKMGLKAQNLPNASVNGALLAQNPNASLNAWLSQNCNASVNGGYMGLIALNASSLYGNPNAAAGLINVNPYGVYGHLAGGGVPTGMGMGVYNWMLGCYGLGGPGTMSGLAGGAGSSLSQSVMQGYWNAYPGTWTAPKTSYAAPPAVGGQPLR